MNRLKVAVVLVATVVVTPLAPVTPTVAAEVPPSEKFQAGGVWTSWFLDTDRFGTSRKEIVENHPCIRLDYRAHHTSICVVAARKVRVEHDGIRKRYKIPATIQKRGKKFRVKIRTADLMLRPGKPTARESCKSVACVGAADEPPVVLKVPPRVLKSCSAKRPWRVSQKVTRKKVVALTLDDGPGQDTAGALTALKKAGVPATFFVVGNSARRDRRTLRRIRAAGHVLGNHSLAHRNQRRLSTKGVVRDLRSTNRIIKKATGFAPCVFRAPYGEDPPHVVGAARRLGLVSVNWNAGAHDYLLPGTSSIVRQTLGNTKPGSIILLHDGGGDRRQTIAALPVIIKRLRERGYRFVTVPDLLRLRPEYK